MEKSEFDANIEEMKQYDVLGVDTENSGTTRPAELWSGQHYLTGISVAWGLDSISSNYYPWRHESENLPREWLPALKEVLTTKTLIFHNAFIDMAALSTLGIEITIPPFDTTVLAHMVNEEFPSKKLDWLSKFILKEEKYEKDKITRWGQTYGWETIPVGMMTPYAKKDAELPLRLWQILWKEMAA